MSTDINTRATAALRALEGAGVIRSAWLPGMRDSAAGAICCGAVPDSVRWVVDDWLSDWCELEGDEELDLSDPVTAASLIVLVREAWGEPDAHCECLFTGEWVVIDGKGNAVRFPKGATEVEALVAALVAKAREVAP